MKANKSVIGIEGSFKLIGCQTFYSQQEGLSYQQKLVYQYLFNCGEAHGTGLFVVNARQAGILLEMTQDEVIECLLDIEEAGLISFEEKYEVVLVPFMLNQSAGSHWLRPSTSPMAKKENGPLIAARKHLSGLMASGLVAKVIEVIPQANPEYGSDRCIDIHGALIGPEGSWAVAPVASFGRSSATAVGQGEDKGTTDGTTGSTTGGTTGGTTDEPWNAVSGGIQ